MATREYCPSLWACVLRLTCPWIYRHRVAQPSWLDQEPVRLRAWTFTVLPRQVTLFQARHRPRFALDERAACLVRGHVRPGATGGQVVLPGNPPRRATELLDARYVDSGLRAGRGGYVVRWFLAVRALARPAACHDGRALRLPSRRRLRRPPHQLTLGVWSSDRSLGIRRVPVRLRESSLAGVVGTLALFEVVLLGPAPGVVFVAAIAAYTAGRRLIFPLRRIPRTTTHGPSRSSASRLGWCHWQP